MVGRVEGIDYVTRRLVGGGRAPSTVDITFTNIGGGNPVDDDFNADAYLSALEKLAAVGVTWVQVTVPGDSLSHAVDVIERFGSTVINAS